MPASDPTALLADLDRRIAKAQRARDAIEGHGGSASGQPEDVVTLSLEEAAALLARVREAETNAADWQHRAEQAEAERDRLRNKCNDLMAKMGRICGDA